MKKILQLIFLMLLLVLISCNKKPSPVAPAESTATPVNTSTVTMTATQQDTATTTVTYTTTPTVTETPTETMTLTVTSTFTITATNTPCPNSNFGDTVTGSMSSNGGNSIYASKFTLSSPAKILGFRVYGQPATNMRAAIYTDTGTAPGTLAVKSDTTGYGAGWITIDMITPVNIPAGTYWLAALGDSSVSVKSVGGQNFSYMTRAYSSDFPDTFSQAGTYGGWQVMMYAIYTCP